MKKAYFSLRRRTIVTPLWLASLALAVVVGFSTWIWNAAASTMVVVVQNAESEPGARADAPLGAAGTMRATRLAMLLGDATGFGRIDAIYVQDSPRSRATAAPLAKRLGLEPQIVAGTDPDALAHAALRDHAGERVLVVAAGDEVAAVVAAVSGRARVPSVEGGDRGLFYVIGVPRIGRTNVLRLRY